MGRVLQIFDEGMKMNVSEIQERLDAMAPVMTDKGLREARATILLNSQQSLSGMCQWFEQKDGFNTQWSHHNGDAPEDVLASMDTWISMLPTRDERKRAEFTAQLAATIELGRANGIDVAYVNPLVEAMKRLSENAIEDRSND